MTPQITVSQSLYDKIKASAEPFVDTPETVITRCVDFYAANHLSAKITPPTGTIGDPTMTFAPDSPPDLSFTRILSLKFNGGALSKQSLWWNAFMFDVVAVAANKLKSKEKLKQMILVNYVEGEGTQEKGYRFIPPAGLSVQGQDANAAWKASFHIIKALGMKVDVVFMWENKDKALHPGKTGQMTFDDI